MQRKNKDDVLKNKKKVGYDFKNSKNNDNLIVQSPFVFTVVDQED